MGVNASFFNFTTFAIESGGMVVFHLNGTGGVSQRF